MPTQTPFLNLTTYNSTTDGSAVYFSDFRAAIAGLPTSANFNLIDTFCSNISGSVLLLEANKPIIKVNAYYTSPGYYTAVGVTQITSYSVNMMIDLDLDITNATTLSLNINGIGAVNVNKIDVSGNLVALTPNDFKKVRHYLLIYNGSVWIWVNATSGDNVSVSGSATELLMISASGVIINSGSLISSFAPSSGSYVVMSLNNNLSKNWLLQSGSGLKITTNTSTSAIIISASFVAGSGIILTNTTSSSAIRFDINLSGSTVMSNTSGSSVKHNASGITAGSYVQVIVDLFGHVTSGCQVVGSSGSFTSLDGQTITVTNGLITSMV